MAGIIIVARKDIFIGEAMITGIILTEAMLEKFITIRGNITNGGIMTGDMMEDAAIVNKNTKPFLAVLIILILNHIHPLQLKGLLYYLYPRIFSMLCADCCFA